MIEHRDSEENINYYFRKMIFHFSNLIDKSIIIKKKLQIHQKLKIDDIIFLYIKKDWYTIIKYHSIENQKSFEFFQWKNESLICISLFQFRIWISLVYFHCQYHCYWLLWYDLNIWRKILSMYKLFGSTLRSEYLFSHITIFIFKNMTITNRYLIW